MTEDPATGLPLQRDPVTDVLLSGRYRLTDELGSGGAGHVYAAEDVLLDRPVAVKVLDGLPDVVAEGRAVRAARAASRASSPRLVEVLDVERGGPSFLVLARVQATSLPAEALAPEHALALLDDVLDALVALHAAAAVHRDVTAANVWLGPDGRAWLTSAGIGEASRDDGLGLRLGAAERERAQAAPSPEQALGLPADARSDVYAAGVLARELLAGREDPAVADVLRRATAEDPPARYADAAELRAALDAALHDPVAELAPDAEPMLDAVPAPAATAQPAPDAGPAPDADAEPAAGEPRPQRPPPVAVRVRRRGDLIRRALVAGCVVLAAWLLFGVPLTSPGVEQGTGGGPLDRLFGPVGTGRAAPAATAAAPPQPAPPDQLPADALAAVLEGAATSPVDLGPETADLMARLGELDRLRGIARQAEAADLYGHAALDAAAGTSSAPLAAQVQELLRPELTVEGLVALVDRDPTAAGPGSRMFATRLRLLAPLADEQRRNEAIALAPAVTAGAADGTLSPSFAAATLAVLDAIDE